MLKTRLFQILIGMAMLTSSALADTYPSQVITVVVPFPAGGPSDVNARRLTPGLSKALGVPVVVENVTGATGAIGASKVAHAKADGYTLLYGSPNEAILVPTQNAAARYQASDLRLIGIGSSSALALIGRLSLPAGNIDELIAGARQRQAPLSIANVGIGSLQHLAAERIREKAGIDALHVPYRGAAPAISDLLGGQVDLAVLSLSGGTLGFIQSGQVRNYGILSSQPDPTAPELALINGGAITGLNMDAWSGFFVPKGTPESVAAKLNAALSAQLDDPAIQQSLKQAGSRTPTLRDLAGLDAFYQEQISTLGKVAAALSPAR